MSKEQKKKWLSHSFFRLTIQDTVPPQSYSGSQTIPALIISRASASFEINNSPGYIRGNTVFKEIHSRKYSILQVCCEMNSERFHISV